jgi:hypothetical protein
MFIEAILKKELARKPNAKRLIAEIGHTVFVEKEKNGELRRFPLCKRGHSMINITCKEDIKSLAEASIQEIYSFVDDATYNLSGGKRCG